MFHVRQLLVLLLLTAAAHAQAVRVAVFSGDDPAGLIVEASLAGNAKVALVDRTHVAKAIAEQKLTMSGVVNPDQAVKLGRLMNADVLVALDRLPDSHAIVVVAFDARTGVRLRDKLLSAAGEEANATAAAEVIRDAAAKFGGQAGQRTVCLLAVRNADLPRQMTGLCEAAGAMVDRQLIEAPGLSVLERSRLDKLTAERNLPTSRPADNALLLSLNLIELQIGRAEAPAGDFRVIALISNTAGKQIGRVEVTSKPDAPSVAAAIGPAIVKSLGAAPPADGKIDHAIEAARFFREGTVRAQHRDWDAAIRAFESAHALSPDDLAIHVRLAKTITDSFGNKHINPHHKPEQTAQRLAIIRRAMDQLLEITDKPHKAGSPFDMEEFLTTLYWHADWLAQQHYNQLDLSGVAGKPHQRLVFSPENLQTFRSLADDYRAIRVGRQRDWTARQVTDAAGFDRYTRLIYQLRAEAANTYRLDDASAAADYRMLMLDWLELAKKYQPQTTSMLSREFLQSDGGVHMDDTVRTTLTTQRSGGDAPRRGGDRDRVVIDTRKVVYQAVATHPDPWMAKYASAVLDLFVRHDAPPSTMPSRPHTIDVVSLQPAKETDFTTPKGVWADARKLIDLFTVDTGRPYLTGPAVQDGFVYVIATTLPGEDKADLELLKIPLAGGPPAVVGRAASTNTRYKDYPKPDASNPTTRLLTFSYTNTCPISGGYYIYMDGPLTPPILFPLDGRSAPRMLAKQPDWPADAVQAAAVVDGRLYAVLGQLGQDGFIIEQDLKGGPPKVLAASRRKEKLSPFDDQPPLVVPDMVADPARKRVLFMATSPNWGAGQGGLYEYSIATGKFRQLAADRTKPAGRDEEIWRTAAAFTPIHRDRVAVVGRLSAIVDLTTDTLTPIPATKAGNQATAIGDNLYWRGMARTRGNEKPTQFPTVRPGVADWLDWPSYLEVIDNQHLLVGDACGLWLVKPPERDPTK